MEVIIGKILCHPRLEKCLVLHKQDCSFQLLQMTIGFNINFTFDGSKPF